MPKKQDVTLQALVVTDQVIEGKDGKKSLIGIFNRIFVRSLPSTHPRMTLFITLLGKEGTKDNVSFVVEKPSGSTMSENTIPFTFSNSGKADLIVNLEGFPIEEIGEYSIIVSQDKKELGRYVIQVSKVKEQNVEEKVVN